MLNATPPFPGHLANGARVPFPRYGSCRQDQAWVVLSAPTRQHLAVEMCTPVPAAGAPVLWVGVLWSSLLHGPLAGFPLLLRPKAEGDPKQGASGPGQASALPQPPPSTCCALLASGCSRGNGAEEADRQYCGLTPHPLPLHCIRGCVKSPGNEK